MLRHNNMQKFILYSSEFKQIGHLARYTDMTLANFTKYQHKIGQVTYATIMVFFTNRPLM